MHPLAALVLACVLLDPAPNLSSGETRHAPNNGGSLSVMTFNIRYNNPEDGVHAWPNRRGELVAFLRAQDPDVLCVQEALHMQVLALLEGLTDYSYRGAGRDDGKTGGEYCAIFFDSRRFTCLQDSTMWLSPTPERPSTGWDAALPRIVTWVKLHDTRSGLDVYVFNTHFDHAGSDARERSASFVRALVHRQSAGLPAIVAGDFNCQESERPYAVITHSDSLFVLRDARAGAIGGARGPHGTFCGFTLTEDIRGPRIDYLFITEGVSVGSYETLRAVGSAGFLSDHLPVHAILTLPQIR